MMFSVRKKQENRVKNWRRKQNDFILMVRCGRAARGGARQGRARQGVVLQSFSLVGIYGMEAELK